MKHQLRPRVARSGSTWEPSELALAWPREPSTRHPAVDLAVEQLATAFSAD